MNKNTKNSTMSVHVYINLKMNPSNNILYEFYVVQAILAEPAEYESLQWFRRDTREFTPFCRSPYEMNAPVY